MADLSSFDALSRKEQNAWVAWFNGGKQHVTQYENKPNSISMGKAECEWVPFQDFWLDKIVGDFKWMTAELEKEGVAIGAKGKPKYKKYRLWPTELGFDIREAELQRWRDKVDVNY